MEQGSQNESQEPSFELPPVPLLTILAPEINTEAYEFSIKRKHLMSLDGEEEYSTVEIKTDDCKEEIEKKMKNVIERIEESASEAISNGRGPVIDTSNLITCPRCSKEIDSRELPIHMSCHAAIILDRILLGDKLCARSKKELVERMKVTHILNAANELPNYLEKEGIQYEKLSLNDDLSEDMIPEMERSYKFIGTFEIIEESAYNQGGTIFVHCAVGKSRSVAVILVFLLLNKGISIEEGLKLVKEKRPIAQPNESYMKQLLEYEKNIQANVGSEKIGQKLKNLEINQSKTEI